MKHPWVVLTAICSLVFGIVVFCVVFGSYSSLLRSQKRIHTAKHLLVAQSRELLGFAGQLPGKAVDVLPERIRIGLDEAVDAAVLVFTAVEASRDVPDPGLIARYEAAQTGLSQAIGLAIEQIQAGQTGQMDVHGSDPGTGKAGVPDPPPSYQDRFDQLKTAVLIMGKRYNKEARYFNTRTKVFPGVLTAPLFDLDEKHFPEIDLRSLGFKAGKEAAGGA